MCALGDIAEEEAPDAVFRGLGYGEDIPSYLRYEGTIRNIRISQKTTIDLVHEICSAKAAHEALGIEPVSVILPLARDVTENITIGDHEGHNREHDDDSDVNSVDSHVHGRPYSATQSSPPRSPSAHTDRLFNSMRPQCADASPHTRLLSSIDSEAEIFIPSLPVLPSNCTMAEFFECFLKVRTY